MLRLIQIVHLFFRVFEYNDEQSEWSLKARFLGNPDVHGIQSEIE